MTHGPLNEAPGGFKPEAEQYTELLASLDGVELGAYDHRILRWLATWDQPVVGTVVSLLHRARAAQPFPDTHDAQQGDDRG